MFCHHCWLFSDRTSSSYSPNWTEVDIGVDNFKKGLEKIVKHEQSVMHLNATSCFMTTKYRITKDETVISQLTSEEKKRVERNRDILKRHIYYVYMSSDGPPKQDSPFWRHCTVRLTCLKSFTCGRRVGKHPLCRLVNKGLHGVGKHLHWYTDFTNLAIAVHASHEVGAVNYGSCCTL